MKETKKKYITIGDIWTVIKKNLILIGCIMVGFIVFGFVFTLGIKKPAYGADNQIIVAVESGTTDKSVDSTSTLRITETIADLAETRAILVPVAQANGCTTDEEINKFVSMLKEKAHEKSSQTNYIVTITIIDNNGEQAVKYVNQIAESLINYVNTTESLEAFNTTLTEVSVASTYYYAAPNKTLYMFAFFAMGIVFAALVVFIKEFASNKFKNKEEIEELGYQIIGVHMYKKNAPEEDDELVEPTISKLEPYNRVLSNIKYASLDNPYKVMMVTSTGSKELKTNMVGNLAFTAARNHKRVLAIDLDVRKPRLHKVFGVERENGMTDFLDGTIANDFKFIKKTVHDVDVITAGKQIDNPYVVFESQKLKDFMDAMKDKYDYIFIDTPPVSICGDGLAISKLCDGVIYNIGMNYVKKNDAKEGLDALKNVDANIIGINVTRYRASKAETYYSYYNYYGENERKKRK